MRNINSFYGDYCIVGRGWAGSLKELLSGKKKREIPWYVLDMSHGFNPGNAYYIDIQTDVAADMSIDYSKKIDSEVIPDNKFRSTILEFLPGFCFDEGTYSIINAYRTTKKNPGWIEVLSGGEIIDKAFNRMKEIDLDPVIDTIKETIRTPGWYVKRLYPNFKIGDNEFYTEKEEKQRVWAYLGNE